MLCGVKEKRLYYFSRGYIEVNNRDKVTGVIRMRFSPLIIQVQKGLFEIAFMTWYTKIEEKMLFGFFYNDGDIIITLIAKEFVIRLVG